MNPLKVFKIKSRHAMKSSKKNFTGHSREISKMSFQTHYKNPDD